MADFHEAFRAAMGFHDYYGRDWEAWIECLMEEGNDFGVVPKFTVPKGGTLTLRLQNVDKMNANRPHLLDRLNDDIAGVNHQRLEQGESPLIALAYQVEPNHGRMVKYGSLTLSQSVLLTGHPGLIREPYIFPLSHSGFYDVWVKEGELGAQRIHLSLGGKPGEQYGAIMQSGMKNQCHGGLLLCDPQRLTELPDDFPENDLWNFFAYGLCFSGSMQHEGWKSNAVDGNIAFVPSNEYYSIAPLIDVPGYAIFCGQSLEE